ncbi:hypothetical protein D3C71_1735420 [compost metagenome]
MLDDEEHLVVLGRQRVLRAQYFIQMQVIAVGHVAREIQLRFFLVDDVFGAVRAAHAWPPWQGGAARRAEAGSARQPGERVRAQASATV